MEAITAGCLHAAVALPTTKRHIKFFEDPEPVSSLCNSTNHLKCNCCCYQTLRLSDQLKAKSGTGKELASKTTKAKKNPLFEANYKNFGIGALWCRLSLDILTLSLDHRPGHPTPN